MTKKFIITAIFFIFFSAFNILADNNFNDTDVSEDPTIQITDVTKPPISGRPRSANRQRINCQYADGMLYIQFAISEGNCELTVVDTETGEINIFYFNSSTTAFINIDSHATFELYILTENGNCYYGSK